MKQLILKQIDKKYGSNTVLSFDEWQIGSGVYWLKGGNGTGKTTLFRIIAGHTPFSGEVLFDNTALKMEPAKFRSKISYAEAEPQYPLFLTGRELLDFYKDVREAKQEDIDQLVSVFEMKDFLDQKIGGYSSGMLKKLSLICAFIGEIELYILDEPLITIDADSAAQLYKLISLKANQGKSFILSSHQEIDSGKLTIDETFMIRNKVVVKC